MSKAAGSGSSVLSGSSVGQGASVSSDNESSRDQSWSAADDERLREFAAERIPVHWEEAEGLVPNRSWQECKKRFLTVLNTTIRRGNWCPAEDQVIVDWVRDNGTSQWAALAEQLPGRNARGARERYSDFLSPDINRSRWSLAEDAELLRLHAEMGPKWVVLATQMAGRSANNCKNRFNVLVPRCRRKQVKIDKPLLGEGHPPPRGGDSEPLYNEVLYPFDGPLPRHITVKGGAVVEIVLADAK